MAADWKRFLHHLQWQMARRGLRYARDGGWLKVGSTTPKMAADQKGGSTTPKVAGDQKSLPAYQRWWMVERSFCYTKDGRQPAGRCFYHTKDGGQPEVVSTTPMVAAGRGICHTKDRGWPVKASATPSMAAGHLCWPPLKRCPGFNWIVLTIEYLPSRFAQAQMFIIPDLWHFSSFRLM